MLFQKMKKIVICLKKNEKFYIILSIKQYEKNERNNRGEDYNDTRKRTKIS